jgi:hypothetical protein
MKQIWKYKLAPIITLEMPKGAQVLTAREQGEDICLWALVSPDAEKEPRRFMAFGTDHNVPEPHEGPQLNLEYRGSAHLDGGTLVFHVFEVL